jgi:apolipoprotein N-acyltransferase
VTIVVSAGIYGRYRLGGAEDEPDPESSSRIGVVQPNVAPESTRAESAGIASIRQQVLATWDLRDRGADLVIWGESAVAVAVPMTQVRELYPRLFTAALRVPSLLGAALTADGPERFYNAAVSVDARGQVLEVYAKRQLAPFSESLPGRDQFPSLAALFPDAREVPGTDRPETIRLLGHPVSVVICFESLLPSLVRKSLADDHGEAIVALVNDAWFGDTWEPWMHFASAKLRAVENGRYVIRAAGSGISGVIDPFGRVRSQTRPLSRDDVLVRIAWKHETTPYQRFGEAPWWLAALAMIVLALAKRPRASGAGTESGWLGGTALPPS